MPQNALHSINPLVEDLLSQEPTGRRGALFGFDFHDPTSKDDKFETFRTKFRSDATKVKEDLEKSGITPIAILPKAFWGRIVTNHKLWDLQPNHYGEVGLSLSDEAEAARKKGEGRREMVVSAIAFVVGGIFGYATYPLMDGWMALFPGLVAMVGAHFAILTLHKIYGEIRYSKKAVFKARYSAALHILATGGERAFMGRVICRVGWGNAKVRITLPEPPPAVAEILKLVSSKAIGRSEMPLHIVAEPAAVGFMTTPVSLLAHAIEDKIMHEERERARIMADPIVCFHQGEAVAIIAQFGDCPIEQAAIQKAISMDAFRDLD